VSIDAFEMVGVMVRSLFLKGGWKNGGECVAVPVASNLVTVLTVGYCVRHKN
jgi:hypothetical protein